MRMRVRMVAPRPLGPGRTRGPTGGQWEAPRGRLFARRGREKRPAPCFAPCGAAYGAALRGLRGVGRRRARVPARRGARLGRNAGPTRCAGGAVPVSRCSKPALPRRPHTGGAVREGRIAPVWHPAASPGRAAARASRDGAGPCVCGRPRKRNQAHTQPPIPPAEGDLGAVVRRGMLAVFASLELEACRPARAAAVRVHACAGEHAGPRRERRLAFPRAGTTLRPEQRELRAKRGYRGWMGSLRAARRPVRPRRGCLRSDEAPTEPKGLRPDEADRDARPPGRTVS
jgi:hypothetical protein